MDDVADRLLRRPEVEEIVGLRTSSLYKLIRSGRFPKPVKITPAVARWRLSEVNAWLGEQRAA